MNATSISLSVRVEHWPIAGSFAISRGAKTEAAVVIAELFDGRCRGRGECVPYARYGETVAGVRDSIVAMGTDIARGLDRAALQQAMPPGAARNALDCAFWDFAAKRAGAPVHALAGLPAPTPLITAYTISLAAPAAMAKAAAQAARFWARLSSVQPSLASTMSSARGVARRTAMIRAGSSGPPSFTFSSARSATCAEAAAIATGAASEMV